LPGHHQHGAVADHQARHRSSDLGHLKLLRPRDTSVRGWCSGS
jgi:hypothetical protein